MKNKIIVGITLVLLVIGLSGCTQQDTQQEDPLNGLGYVNNQHEFGMNPPEGWTTDTSGTMGMIVIFYAPINDDIRENINVLVDTLPSGFNLSSYADSAKSQASNYLTNCTLISSNTRTVSEMNAYEYVYTYTQGTYALEGKQVIVEKNSKLIILTYTANTDDYNTYSQSLEQCLNSLKIV